jgi:putative copper export protein
VSEGELARFLLRVLVYVASIAAAGGVLFRASFPRASADIRPALDRQIIVGCCLLLLVEPLRYAAFQVAAAQGDWGAAFGPDLRWMAFQTPMGQAAGTRWIAALALLALGLRWTPFALAVAVIMIGSFALEGHSASAETRTVLGTAGLLIHVAAVHWWLGALYPLLRLTRHGEPSAVVATVDRFSRRAVWIVGGLVVAGALLLAVLTGWTLRIESAYQQRFLFKLGLVAFLLSLAAWNKQRLTPLLAREYEVGSAKLANSIRIEIVVGFAILAATAWAISVSPED